MWRIKTAGLSVADLLLWDDLQFFEVDLFAFFLGAHQLADIFKVSADFQPDFVVDVLLAQDDELATKDAGCRAEMGQVDHRCISFTSLDMEDVVCQEWVHFGHFRLQKTHFTLAEALRLSRLQKIHFNLAETLRLSRLRRLHFSLVEAFRLGSSAQTRSHLEIVFFKLRVNFWRAVNFNTHENTDFSRKWTCPKDLYIFCCYKLKK